MLSLETPGGALPPVALGAGSREPGRAGSVAGRPGTAGSAGVRAQSAPRTVRADSLSAMLRALLLLSGRGGDR
jgi:hypothetical protein